LGGISPSKPARIFCMRLDDVRYPDLYPSVLEKHERGHPREPFDYQGARLI